MRACLHESLCAHEYMFSWIYMHIGEFACIPVSACLVLRV